MSALDLLTLTLADSRGYNDIMKKIAGFTLVEMMIVLVLLAVVAGIGLPNLTQMVRNNQMTTQANSVLGAFQLARSEAVRRGVPVVVCGTRNGTSCDQTGWGQGWIVFANASGTGNDPSAAGNEVIRVSLGAEGIDASVSGGSGTVVRFAETSLLHANSAREIRLARSTCGPERARRIQVVVGGRASVEEVPCS